MPDFFTFARNFKGNPEQTVKQMVSSGQISNDTLNNAIAQTNQLYKQIFGNRSF
jgi:hypothetical protein